MKVAIKKMNHKKLGGKLMAVANDPLGFSDYQDPCCIGSFRVCCYGVGGGGYGEQCFICGLPGLGILQGNVKLL